MCGIAGVLTTEAAPGLAAEGAARMARALLHRGPDDRGEWVSRDGGSAFVNTRLAIIDPTPAGRQPMSIDNGRLTVTFNGEIYNFVELRQELEARGVIFHSRADTEVLLRAYDAFGERCVERLRGMFAFAIWDARARTCLLARDRLGIKPLYYSLSGNRLVFASELRALLASGLVPPDVDPTSAYEYFRTGSVPEPRTLLAGARVLEAGHLATWKNGAFDERPYFDLSFEPAITPDDAAARTREALVDAVRHHFVGDLPIGIFLSGGVDSTALLAIAAAVNRHETRAMTMALPGGDEDESELATRTAQHFGVRHDVCRVDAASARPLFDEYLRAMDQPSIDGMNTLAVATLARDCGVKVMLSGIGADELFGGYPSVRAIPRFTAWNRRLATLGAIRGVAGRALERLPDPRWRRVGDMLGQPPTMAVAYATYRGIFTRAEARRLTEHFVGGPIVTHQPAVAADRDPSPEDAACRLDVSRYLRNQLLRDADVMSMARGVELRVPFLDVRVVETVAAIPHGTRLARGKRLLQAAVPEIPEWIRSQPKRGFMFPVDRWLDGAWRGVFEEAEARSPVPAGTWYRQWCVHAFNVWMERLRGTVAPLPPAAQAVSRGVNG